MLPSENFVGEWYIHANFSPDRSTSFRWPSRISKTPVPLHSPPGPVGTPSMGQGQITWQWQVVT